VPQELLKAIGNNWTKGADLLKRFQAAPYGWSKDAIDASLVALLAVNAIKARLDGQPKSATDFSAQRTSLTRAEFQGEEVIITAEHRLGVAGLARKVLGLPAGAAIQQSELPAIVVQLLDALVRLADAAGGDAPRPIAPPAAHITALRELIGNERILRVYEQRERLAADFAAWSEWATAIQAREPRWTLLNELLARSAGLDPAVADGFRADAEAIRANRALLDDPDPVRSLLDRLATALRLRLRELHDALEADRAENTEALVAMPEWQRVSDDAKDTVLRDTGLLPLHLPEVGTDELLRDALTAMPLSAWADRRDAIPGRIAAAREKILKLLTPAAVRVTLPSTTLRTHEDIDRWVAAVGKLLKEKMGTGTDTPVIV